MNTSRREFLKTSAKVSAAAIIAPSFYIGKSKPAISEEVIGHGDFKYRVHKEWGNLDPSKTPVNNCHSMVQAKNGLLYMIGDNSKNNIIVYDRSGKLVDHWGTTYWGGHGLTIKDEGGEEFLYLTDTNGCITKTDLKGNVIMVIEHPATHSIYEVGQKFMPTETAIGPNGDIYIIDGYGSNVVTQYNAKGEYIRTIGTGWGSGDYQLMEAHGICIDDRDKDNPTLLLTSRRENKYKRFTLDGKYIETIDLPGAYICRAVIHGENLYSAACWSSPKPYIDGVRATHPIVCSQNSGFVTILDKNNKVISNPGGTAPVYKNGKISERMVQDQKIFNHCHDVCIDNDENVYVCQWRANKTYPVKLERV